MFAIYRGQMLDRKTHWIMNYFHDDSHSSLGLSRTLQPAYVDAQYLSEHKVFPNRRPLSRFRSGCHGLHVDIGRWENSVQFDRKTRLV